MKKHVYFSIVFLVSMFSACTSKTDAIDDSHAETIHVEVPQQFTKINFDEYFSNSTLVTLETSERSLIQQISRIVRYNEKIYILDKGTNSVLVFNDNGKFDYKIQAEGRGPGEYESLTDFAVDRSTGNMFLYADRPYKLLVFSDEGEFIEESRMEESYNNVSYQDGKLLFLNRDESLQYMLIERDVETRKQKGYLPFDDLAIFYASLGSPTPYIINSKNTYITFPYSNIVYQYTGASVEARYIIDFGDKNPPSSIEGLDEDPVSHYTSLLMDNYGIGLSNFSEKDDFIAFTYGAKTMALYNKDTKETKSFNFVEGADKLLFDNFFAHDGNDNTLISIIPASKFKATMDRYRSDPKIWNKISEPTQLLAEEIREDDNPLLMIYTLK